MNRYPNNILYLSYTGLLEPLGQSQILNYLQILSEEHEISLITFEKPEDLKNTKELQRLENVCINAGINWVPLTYHKNPRLLATGYDMGQFLFKAIQLIKQKDVQVIHCRGYIPTFVGMLLNKLTGRPYIFDMRAFWPEEMVSAGRLEEGSIMHKGIKKLEQRALRTADRVVTLTHASADYLREQGLPARKMNTIPACVNLNHFMLPEEVDNTARNNGAFTLGVVGTVTGWFQFDRVLLFFKALKQQKEKALLKICSQDDKEWIRQQARKHGLKPKDIDVSEVPFEAVPGQMHRMDAGIFFYKPSLSELARSPTKMGEFLACGVPCVANTGVGDVPHIINKYEVGVLLDNDGEKSMEEAASELIALKEDPDLPGRCRHAAEEWYAVEKGAADYAEIYRELAKQSIK